MKLIYGVEKQLDWLEKQPEDTLTQWTAKFLKTGDSHPLALDLRNTYPSSIISQLHDTSRDEQFKSRINNTVEHLLQNAPLSNGRYLGELVGLVGELRIGNCFGKLLSHAKSGRLKGMRAFGVDLHHQLLRVLLGFPDYNQGRYGRDLEYILTRDITEPLYFSLCFRAGWEGFGTFDHGMRSLVDLMEFYDAIPRHFLRDALGKFFNALGMENFKDRIQEIWPELDSVQQSHFLKLASLGGFHMKPPSEDIESLIYRVEAGATAKMMPSSRIMIIIRESPPERTSMDLVIDLEEEIIRNAFKEIYPSLPSAKNIGSTALRRRFVEDSNGFSRS